MEDNESKKNNWFAGLLITAFVFLALGYGWRWAQEPLQYEQGYLDAIAEVDMVTKGEICQ